MPTVSEKKQDLARSLAQLILDYSHPTAGVQYILQFGSLARGDEAPGDIDLVILHNRNLREFDPTADSVASVYPGRNVTCHADVRPGDPNFRFQTNDILKQLGSREYSGLGKQFGPDDEAVLRMAHGQGVYCVRPEYAEQLRRDAERYRVFERAIQVFTACTGADPRTAHREFCRQFDIHVLHTGLFSAAGTSLRAQVVDNCKDPTFWGTVLATGKIYDATTQEFTYPVHSTFPEALGAFPQALRTAYTAHLRIPLSRVESLRTHLWQATHTDEMTAAALGTLFKMQRDENLAKQNTHIDEFVIPRIPERVTSEELFQFGKNHYERLGFTWRPYEGPALVVVGTPATLDVDRFHYIAENAKGARHEVWMTMTSDRGLWVSIRALHNGRTPVPTLSY